MQKQVNQRQLAWIAARHVLEPEKFFDFADELKNNADFGPVQNLAITLSGGALPLQLTGDPSQVRSEYEQLTDKRFTSVAIKAVFPNAQNLNLTLSAHLQFGHINISIQNGTEEIIQKIFLLVSEFFPRSTGPSDEEIEQQSVKLAEMIREAEKAVRAGKEAEKSTKEIENIEKSSKRIFDTIQNHLSESEKLSTQIKTLANESSQKATEINNLLNQIQSNRDTSQKLRDDIGANEAKIREFFNEIEKYQKTIVSTTNEAKNKIESFQNETSAIIEKNKSLQKEVKEHLLKAVGASLFSAFEKRKKRIEFSKWIWAALTATAIIAQVLVIVWIANHVQSIQGDIPFYKTPGFILRVTVSIPIVFFIGYAIHQYAKEREYEELYGFKSSISFSLSPYLDLVKKIK
ncbi:Predicted nucleic acid-binding protein, contains Zn-ribbon domain [Desulfacinum infernum DSM 9756]|uniref:Predicted nucleic acid-binding protein, contains Zn-ribbon domain n=1 Tax=Desulfacinum infernum DSM 9756 TaxID=1121391 RepID=A0A1M5J3E5_9BACT|nr:hypothetical protein [Desulfacinum infernum]SHG35138.1 Predicted nucleic acid-binding protein, contains Zn-ribbon domain [Desulfacinum infernum DSM 9756]